MLIDTDILVDYLRKYPPAIRFLERVLLRKKLRVSVVSKLELIKGSVTKNDEFLAARLLSHFTILMLDPAACETAITVFQIQRWKTNPSIADAFIAATALRHKLPLITRNTKDFEGIPSLIVQKPY